MSMKFTSRCRYHAILTWPNCSAKMSPHEGDIDVEPGRTEATAGAERGDPWATDGWEGRGIAGPVGEAGTTDPCGLSRGGGRCSCPRQPGEEAGKRAGGVDQGTGAGVGPHQILRLQPPAHERD